MRYSYDAAGQTTAMTDPESRTTTFEYDALGRQVKVTLPDPDSAGEQLAPWTTTTYDAVGNVLTNTDRLGNTTTFTYDNLYRRTSDIDANPSLENQGTTNYTFDALGNMLTLTDPEHNTTTFTYDGLDRLIAEENELEDVRDFTFDDAGNFVRKVDREGRVTEYEYDHLHRRTVERWLEGVSVLREITMTYDDAGQLLTISDPDSSYAFVYDELGRVISIDNVGTTGAPNVVLTQTYDEIGNRLSVAATIDSAADYVNEHVYDYLNRMTRVTQHAQLGASVLPKRVDFSYNAASQWSSTSRYSDLSGGAPNEVARSTFTYDLTGRLTSLDHSHANASITGYSFGYDAASRLTDFLFTNEAYEAESATYNYDQRGQLIDADREGTEQDESFAYDANGNRLAYETHPNNQLFRDGTYEYEYDEEGNRKKRTVLVDGLATGAYTEYTWDHRNRLTNVIERDSGDTILKRFEYTYDAFNRRIAKSIEDDVPETSPAVITRYVYDGDEITLTFDGSGNLTHRYLYGPLSDYILADEDTGLSRILWPLPDHLGTVRDLVDINGAVQNHITFDSLGRVLSESDDTFECRRGYAGLDRDEETTLYHSYTRYYDPVLGIWIQPDWIGFAGGDNNLYRYVHNSVISKKDPDGRQAVNGIRLEYKQLTWDDFPEGNPKPNSGDLKDVGAMVRPQLTLTHDAKAGLYGSRTFTTNAAAVAYATRYGQRVVDRSLVVKDPRQLQVKDPLTAAIDCVTVVMAEVDFPLPKGIAFINTNNMWVKPEHRARGLPAADDTLLQHEQGHFDITQIYANRLSAELRNLRSFGLSDNEDDAETIARRKLMQLVSSVTAAYTKFDDREQKIYDGATEHGLLSTQEKWTLALKREVAKGGSANINSNGEIVLQ